MSQILIMDRFAGALESHEGGVTTAKTILTAWKAEGEDFAVEPMKNGDRFVTLVDAAGEPGDIYAVVKKTPNPSLVKRSATGDETAHIQAALA